MSITSASFGHGWYQLLDKLYHSTLETSPRGQRIREILDAKLTIIDPMWNILVSKERNLNHRFMVAEWLWILNGRNDVASIGVYNKNLAQFSNDGLVFDGAYGPMIKEQWARVRSRLLKDHDTRQAVIQIFKQPSYEGIKDVPCTMAIQWFIRAERLWTIVTMRSSDIWLGLPYDFFSFSMLSAVMKAELEANGIKLGWGSLTYNLGSSHLYERNFEAARKVLEGDPVTTVWSPMSLPLVPDDLKFPPIQTALDWDPTWRTYRNILVQPVEDALPLLKELEKRHHAT